MANTRPKSLCTVEGCGKPHLSRGWCSMHYSRMRNHGTLADPVKKVWPLADRLWPRIDKNGAGGCWIWTGAINAQGYGAIGVDGKVKRVHRVVYMLLVGDIPDGLHLDHLCRRRHCCNPDHLEPVTNRQNWERGFSPGAVTIRDDRCARGHVYSENARLRPNGARTCRLCEDITNSARKAAKKEGGQ